MSDVHAAQAADEEDVRAAAAEAGDDGSKSGDGEKAEKKTSPEIEQRARNMGWRPQEEYKGSRPWMPADEFVENIERNVPLMLERNRFLNDEVTKLNRKLDDSSRKLDDTLKVLQEFRQYNETVAQTAYERARRELEEKRDRQIADADVEGARKTIAEIEALKKPEIKTAPAEPETKQKHDEPARQPEISAAAQAFISANRKIVDDPDLYQISVGLHGRNLKKGMTEEESFAVLAEQVRAVAPEMFENPARKAPGAVSPPAPPKTPNKGRKTYEDLPPWAKDQCDRFCRTIEGFTRDKYVADFDWSAAR